MFKQCLLVSLASFLLGYLAGCIEFNCDTGQSQHIEYQCTVEIGFVLIWQIVAENSICTKKYTELSTVSALKPISECPEFKTVLLSTTPQFMSNISFNVESNITGLTIICKDVSGTTEECRLLAPSEMNVTYTTTRSSDNTVQVQIDWTSDQSDRPSLTAVYLSHNVSGEEREVKLPGEESGQHNISASASGNAQYQITVFGENILGNGTQSNLLVYYEDISESTATSPVPPSSSTSLPVPPSSSTSMSVQIKPTVNPIEGNGNNIGMIIGLSVGISLAIIAVAVMVTILIVRSVMAKKQSSRRIMPN